MNHFLNIIPTIGLMFIISSQAYSQFSLQAEIRPRAEFRNGFKTTRTSETDPAFFVEQRSRIYMNFKREKMEFHIALQDVRIWGNAGQVYKNDPSLDNLFEGWASLNFTKSWWVKVGRQVISYDNQRFLGGLDWAQQGRSHDAAIVTYKKKESGLTVDMTVAYNQNVPFEPFRLSGTEYFGVANYKTMQYVRVNKKNDKGDYSFLIHNDGRQAQDTTMAYRQTYGFYGNVDLGSFIVGGDLYYQGGKNILKEETSAFLVSAFATKKTDLTPLTLGFDFLSGTSRDETVKDKSFIPLYGTNHKFYGFMDYFYVGNPHGQGGNLGGLIDIYFKTKFKLSEKSSLIGDFHYFASPVTVYDTQDPTTEISKSLGPEIDLVYVLNIAKDITFWVGYSHIFPTESLVAIKRGVGEAGAMHNWAWAMIQFKPILFSSEK